MDSNNPSPFLGLELSVDARNAQQDDDRGSIRTVAAEIAPRDESRTDDQPVTTSDHQFVTTSESLEHSGNVKFSLPAVELKSGSIDAEEVDAIMSRFPGS